MGLAGKSLISINDYTKNEWLQILKLAKQFETKQTHPSPSSRRASSGSLKNLLAGKVIANLFFEPSTRTRLSFESAVQRLGGSAIGFSDSSATSVQKGETLKDTIRTVSNYADLIVIRHPLEGSARLASEHATVPVINAGDGANQHPTQTLLDLYSIQKTQGRLQRLVVAFMADLKYSRTVHSLVHALSQFPKNSFMFVSPPQLRIPDNLRLELERRKIPFLEFSDVAKALDSCDVLYANRIQKERFADPIEYERVKNSLRLSRAMLAKTKPNLKILNPLPRVNEIDEDVDEDNRAYYFEQTRNGIYVRQTIVASILGLRI